MNSKKCSSTLKICSDNEVAHIIMDTSSDYYECYCGKNSHTHSPTSCNNSECGMKVCGSYRVIRVLIKEI